MLLDAQIVEAPILPTLIAVDRNTPLEPEEVGVDGCVIKSHETDSMSRVVIDIAEIKLVRVQSSVAATYGECATYLRQAGYTLLDAYIMRELIQRQYLISTSWRLWAKPEEEKYCEREVIFAGTVAHGDCPYGQAAGPNNADHFPSMTWGVNEENDWHQGFVATSETLEAHQCFAVIEPTA